MKQVVGKLVWAVVLGLLLACSEPVVMSASRPSPGGGGGTDIGNASDRVIGRDQRWTQKESLKVCVEGLSEAQRAAHGEQVLRAFATWNSYLIERLGPVSREPIAVEISSPQTCVTEGVVFAFGTDQSVSDEDRAKFPSADAFAIKRGQRGLVWLSPQIVSLDEARLFAVLLHEIGHIYGNPHVEGTVMEEGYAEKVSQLPAAYLGKIDHSRQLLSTAFSLREVSTEVRASEASCTFLLGQPCAGETISLQVRRGPLYLQQWMLPLGIAGTLRALTSDKWDTALEFAAPSLGVSRVWAAIELDVPRAAALQTQVFVREDGSGKLSGYPHGPVYSRGNYNDVDGRQVGITIEFSVGRTAVADLPNRLVLSGSGEVIAQFE